MNCLSRLSSCATSLFPKKLSSHFSLTNPTSLSNTSILQNTAFQFQHLKKIELGFLSVRVRCFASKRRKKTEAVVKEEGINVTEQDQEKNGFFVVRKGDLVGVYNSLSDCQAQVGSSICDPPVSVFKGYSLEKETVDHLLSHGLQNALYAIRAADLKEDLFGTLVPLPFRQPSSKGEASTVDTKKKRSQETLGLEVAETDASISSKHLKLDRKIDPQTSSCIIEFDGASKGNPGQGGAGAVLRAEDGTLICRLREGIGKATNNVAEYRAVILGLKGALRKGYKRVHVRGDSKLVCMQVLQGSWKVRSESISTLCKEAKNLKTKFTSFEISHMLRKFNSAADAQANLAVSLADGQVQEEFG